MPEPHIIPLNPIPEDLRLFSNTFSADEDSHSLAISPTNADLDEVGIHSSTSTLSIDDEPHSRSRLTKVPPLELASRDSSLFAANDPFKDHSDINLRSDSEDEVISDPTDSESITDDGPSKRWDQLNAKLKQVEQRRPTRLSKSFMNDMELKKSTERLIYIKEQKNGLPSSPSTLDPLPKTDFIKVNKNVKARKQKTSGYSYRSLHQLKSPLRDSGSRIPNLFDEPPSVPRRVQSFHQTHFSNTENIQDNPEPRSRSQEFVTEADDYKNETNTKPQKHSNGSRHKKRWKTIGGYCLHPRATASPIRRRSLINQVNPNHPDKEYVVHSVSHMSPLTECYDCINSISIVLVRSVRASIYALSKVKTIVS
ncbi:unnamed protein product [Echinostoma caproni]|uniref:MKLP1_Arf_bdg domain-containing protein n=1 Tax=Echinostoma caproni TaxID=27848 RepID=A0A183AJN6_9TREM|nr:unnamed protein product [Echinostoma caproni]